MTSTNQELSANCPARDLFLRTSDVREVGLTACAKFRGEERTGWAGSLFVTRVRSFGVSAGWWWSVAWVGAVDLGATRDWGDERRAAASASHFVKGRLQTGRAKTFVVFSFAAIESLIEVNRISGWNEEQERTDANHSSTTSHTASHSRAIHCHPLHHLPLHQFSSSLYPW